MCGCCGSAVLHVALNLESRVPTVGLAVRLQESWAPSCCFIHAPAWPRSFRFWAHIRGFLAGKALIKRVPQRRLGQLTELDGPMLLLVSDAGSFMTGSVVTVDGGHLVSSL